MARLGLIEGSPAFPLNLFGRLPLTVQGLDGRPLGIADLDQRRIRMGGTVQLAAHDPAFAGLRSWMCPVIKLSHPTDILALLGPPTAGLGVDAW